MRKYAFLKENIVVKTEVVSDEQCSTLSRDYQLLIDIQDMNPEPQIGYILNGNILTPFETLSQTQIEESLARKKCEVGTQISSNAIIRLGALNKMMGKTGAQVSQVLSNLVAVKSLLETGALGTARAIMSQLISIYPEYTEILSEAINKINDFESKYGL